MKKIKGLLLFGILTLLGIGSSFAINYNFTGGFTVIHTFESNYSYGYGSTNAFLLNHGNYGGYKGYIRNYNLVSNGFGSPGSFWGSYNGYSFGTYTNNSWVSGFPNFKYTFYSPYGLSITGTLANDSLVSFVSNITNNSEVFGGRLYTPEYGDSYPLIYDYSNQNYMTFENETTLGVNGTSFSFGNKGLLKHCFYGDKFSLSCVFFSGSNYNLVNFVLSGNSVVKSEGYLVVPVYSYSQLTGQQCYSNASSHNCIFTIGTGVGTFVISFSDSSVYYNYYDVVVENPLKLNDYTISSKGIFDGITPSVFLSRSSFLYNSSVSPYLNYGYFSEFIYQSGTNNLFYRSNIPYYFQSTTDNYLQCLYFPQVCMGYTQLNPVSNSSVPDIDLNGGLGVGTQSTGSIAINTGFLDLCLNNLEFGELNSYLCSKLLNGNNLVLIPNMTGYYLSYGYDENGNLTFWITYQEDLEQQMSGFVWVQDENGNRFTTCPSGDCLGSILAQPINHGNTGFEFTTGTVLDMITNLTGWVGRCPFPYTDFRLGKNLKLLQTLQDWGFNYDPFIIVNCAVAGFHYGRHSIDRQIFDDIFDHPLLYGDTQKHRSLFVFLDFIVILGLLGLSAFLKKIF